MSQRLHEEHCVEPGAGDALDGQAMAGLLRLVPGWHLVDVDGESRLERSFPFPDFGRALAFTNRVGEMAEAENHHPAIVTEWGRVKVTWWTHKVGGLQRNDFVAAAKTDRLFDGPGGPGGP
jgi:4a-hydroxytetrahydrobiopterin dehydratase